MCLPGVSAWAFTVHRMVLRGDGMLKKKTMDCCRLISYRKGYGYTLLRVGDRGMWHCEIAAPGKRTNDIVFVDGKFEEILGFFKDIIS